MGVLANWDRYIQLQGLSMLAAPAQASGNDRKGASLCENVRKPRMRRMVFLYSLLPIAPAKFLVFKLTKSRRTFYAHDERLSFRTASGNPAHSPIARLTAGTRRFRTLAEAVP
jgi:hypothetical protein